MSVNKYSGIIEDLRGLLKIPSVQGEPQPGRPFGVETYSALKYMLDLGSAMGFGIKDVDGYAGHIEWGEGEDVFGVLCHLDVVPAGENWCFPPYGAVIDNGKIFARGALDNKSPAVAVLYAMKRLKEEGFVPNKKVRLIMGLNEESGWKCIDYYFSKEKMPVEGFSPDADFPVINCEKGVLHLNIAFKTESDKITSIEGGNRVNMVADRGMFKLASGIIKRFEGISAHGSAPHKGTNALFPLFNELSVKDADKGVTDIYNFLCKPESLVSLGLNLEDEISGKLTLNFGTVNKNGGFINCGVDIRFPVSFTKEEILEILNKNLPDTCVITELNYHKPLYVSPDDPLIKSLLAAYSKVVGKEANTITIGGATYARALTKGVAFGPVFPWEESKIHTADESIGIDELYKMTDIYYEALKSLL